MCIILGLDSKGQEQSFVEPPCSAFDVPLQAQIEPFRKIKLRLLQFYKFEIYGSIHVKSTSACNPTPFNFVKTCTKCSPKCLTENSEIF